MLDRLAALHDSHNSSLCLIMSVCGHTLVSLLILLFGLLELDLVDLDAILGIGEAQIDDEGISLIYVLAFW